MKFDFYTLGGRFLWEDVFNYQDWIIQRSTRTNKYRLLDPYNIRRDSGEFTRCKDTLLKYVEAYELEEPYKDTVILLHNFGRTKNSLKPLAESLKSMKANIVVINYASFRKSLNYQVNLLSLFLKNIAVSGKLYFITNGAGGLILRKMISTCDNYREYNIARILEINPMNSGSDIADILCRSSFLRELLGPMLKDITVKRALTLAKLPKEIQHGIIFYPSAAYQYLMDLLSSLESFPYLSPPSERSYAEDVVTFSRKHMQPLSDPLLAEYCKKYIETGTFPQSESLEAEVCE